MYENVTRKPTGLYENMKKVIKKKLDASKTKEQTCRV